jgi:TonB family protein
MNQLRLLFFLALLVAVIWIARRNISRNSIASSTPTPAPHAVASASPPSKQVAATSPQPSASAAPSAAPANFKKAAERVTPAVALISTFDTSGKLLRSGSGVFVSRDGDLLTCADLLQGAAHAVAKIADGRFINIDGIRANAPNVDLALLKVETKKGVPFITPNESARIDNGVPVAVVGSTLMHRDPPHFERTTAQRGSDGSGDYFGLSAALPNDCLGAPIVDDKGEMVGIVTSQHPPGASGMFARSAAAAKSVVEHVDPHGIAAWPGEPASPAEGPTAPPTRVAKIPLVRADSQGMTKLLYSPKPKFPVVAQRTNAPVQGEGRYRIRFDANGRVQGVEVVQSTNNPALDNAAVSTLRQWKAAPGQEWSATVPISFTP